VVLGSSDTIRRVNIHDGDVPVVWEFIRAIKEEESIQPLKDECPDCGIVFR